MDLDNIIFTSSRELLGVVEDVFGNIKNPFYCVAVDPYVNTLLA